MYIIYFLIVLISDIVGSISGMGGSIIIKPLMTMISPYPLQVIIFCSNLSIIVMCISSIIAAWKKKEIALNTNSLHLLLGSLFGSLVAGFILNEMFAVMSSTVIKRIQIVLLILQILAAIYYQIKEPRLNRLWTKGYHYFLLGIFCGFTSIILGIGGGIINVMLLMWFMGMNLKQATSYSLISVFVTIGIRLITSIDLINKMNIPLSLILTFICAAIVGGISGVVIKKYFKPSNFKKIYIITLTVAICINILNIWL